LALAGLAAPGQAAADATAVGAALQQARAQGCQGRPGLRQSLVQQAALDRVAQAVSRGADLQAALREQGYRSLRAGSLSMRGYASAQDLAQGLRQQACKALLDADWKEAGWYRRGDAAWIVLAAPFSPPRPQEQAQVRAQVLQETNRARAQARRCGDQFFAAAPPLQPNAFLERAAQAHAADMAEHSYFSHTGRDGSQVGQRATRADYAWRRVGENLAAGQTTAAQAVQGWLDSPGHCANLMQAAYTEMGLAYEVNLRSEGGIYWVQVLGTPR
jgi:uncharacterized protein YkwD